MRIRSSFSVFTALILAMMLVSAAPLNIALAQETENEAEPEEKKSEIRTLPPAYESQMLRLAEVLGSLHYLRELCGADEGQTWRNEMQTMLEAEGPVPQRRAQLIAHFNRGFRGYSEIYRECTPPASEAANQFLKQGVRLSSEIPNRFGR